MIKTKEDLQRYLKEDMMAYDNSLKAKIKNVVLKEDDYYVKKYLKILRKTEYFKNNSDCLFNKVLYQWYYYKWFKISRKTGLYIRPNSAGPGLTLYHTCGTRTGAVPETRIGSHVIIRPGVIIGYRGDTMRGEKTAPVIDDYVEFSWGVKVFGKIKVGRGALLNANCVVMGNVPPYAIVVGNPAKVVGFTMTPKEIVDFETTRYPVAERYSLEDLQSNYRKFFLDKIKDIKSHLKNNQF